LKTSNYILGGTFDPDYGPLPVKVASLACRLAENPDAPDTDRWRWIRGQRIFNCVLGALTVALLIAMASLTHGRRTALLAGFIGACSEGLVFWSKTESINPQANLWAMAFLLAAALIAKYRHPALWLAAGAVGGLMIATKETFFGGLVMLPLLALGFYGRRRHGSWSEWRWLALGMGLFSVMVVALYLVAGSLDWEHFASRFTHYSEPDVQATMPGPAHTGGGIGHYLVSQPFTIINLAGKDLFTGAWLLVLVGLAGRRKPGWPLRMFPAALAFGGMLILMLSFPFTIGIKRLPETYDLVPAGLTLTPFIARAIERIAAWRRLPRAIGLGLAGLICCYTLLVGAAVDINLTQNTRYALLNIAQDDPVQYRIYIDLPDERDYPLLPRGWTIVDTPEDADLYLIHSGFDKQRDWFGGWQEKWHIEPPWSTRLTWYEFDWNPEYTIMQRRD